MNFLAAKCPGCGASIQLPSDRKSANCMYCGSLIVVEEAVKLATASGPDAKTLVELGNTSLAAGRDEEAYGYFSRATEVDLYNADAWFGKAKASSGQATLNDMRTDEVKLCSKKYVELTEFDSGACVAAVKFLTGYANMLCRAADGHFKEYGGTFVGPMGSMVPSPVESECLSWANRTIEATNVHIMAIGIAEEHAKEELPDALRGALNSLKPFVEKAYMAYIRCTVHFTDGSSHGMKSNVPVKISDEQRKSLLGLYATYRLQLESLEPGAVTDIPSASDIFAEQNRKASSSWCFVATVCYGSIDAEPVQTLREFRDRVLLCNAAGRIFVKAYYAIGPYLADFISTRDRLRFKVRDFLIAPLARRVRSYLSRLG